MKLIAVIPARYNSVRLPGKPLVKILGIPMIKRVYSQVKKSKKISRVIVATDDCRIFKTVSNFGGEVCMTSLDCKSGTDRVWEIVRTSDCDGVINVQGDEPLISPDLISRVADKLIEKPNNVISAVSKNYSYQDFTSEHNVKAVVDLDLNALYFSRSPVPFSIEEKFTYFLHHYGIYGYSKSLLEFFIQQPQSALEIKEKLEQLRFLENGKCLNLIITKEKSYGVDTFEDIKRVEVILENCKSIN